MNPELLNAIHEVEAKYKHLDNPFADLSKVHKVVKQLGMPFGRYSKPRANDLWFNRKYDLFYTCNKQLIYIYRLIKSHTPRKMIVKKTKNDPVIIRYITKIVKANYRLKLIPKTSLKSIVG